MSGRLPNVDNLCTNPENHKQHMCELRLAGKDVAIKNLTHNPTHICGNCATKANDPGALCSPGPVDAPPSVK